ncbi:MAG: FapA family protein [Clostridiales bacterium]|nr:FapA family protein [Clostridiales bacterium]
MKKQTTKLIALVISVLMLATLLPAMTFAAEEPVCEIGSVQYADFGDALAAVQDGETIKILKDIEYDKTTVWSVGSYVLRITDKSITFDLNGYVLSLVNLQDATPSFGLMINNGDVCIIGDGEFNITGYTAVRVEYNGKTEVTNVTSFGDVGCGIEVQDMYSTVTVNGDITAVYRGVNSYGAVVVNGDINSQVTGVYAWGDAADVIVNGDITVNGLSSTSEQTMGVRSYRNAKVTVNGSITVNDNGDGETYGVYAHTNSAGGSVIVNGDINVNSVNSIGVAARYENSLVTVNGGIIVPDDGTYIRIGTNDKTEEDGVPSIIKPGYFEYTDEISYVWVLNQHPCALDHDWGEWIVTTPATYEADGVETRVCAVCGEEETRAIPKLVQEKPLLDQLNDAIANGDYYGDGPITVVINGVEYVFESNNGNYNGNGTLFCTIDGVVYKLDRNAKGIKGVKN